MSRTMQPFPPRKKYPTEMNCDHRVAGSRGFSLIELMIVLAIIAIIAAIAIPSLLHARKAANEAAAISALRNVCTAQFAYRLRFGTYGTLADLIASASVDDSFSDGLRSGYSFATTGAADPSIWAATASPTDLGYSGDRYFYVDQSGIIRYQDSVPATATDPPIE